MRTRVHGTALGAVLSCAACAPTRLEPIGLDDEALVVRRATWERRLLLTGELAAEQSFALTVPRTDSWNIAVRHLADDGAFVREGDAVVELDNKATLEKLSELRLALTQAELDLRSKDAENATAEQDRRHEVEAARTELAKAELDASVPAELVSRREFEKLRLAVATAKVKLATAEDDLRAITDAAERETEVKRIAVQKARRSYESTQTQLDALVLRAPRDGVVVIEEHPWEGRKIQIGDNVWPGLSVAGLPDLSHMQVRAQASDVDDGLVHPGMRAHCLLDAYPDRPLGAVVTRVSPVARKQRQSSSRRFFSVVLDLDETDAAIMRSGLSVKVEIVSDRRDDVLVVPRVAIDASGERPVVRRAAGEAAVIALGPCDAQACVVLSGVQDGDVLVRAGAAP